jgi:hypothetical protein
MGIVQEDGNDCCPILDGLNKFFGTKRTRFLGSGQISRGSGKRWPYQWFNPSIQVYGATQDDAFFKSDFPSGTPGSHIDGRRAWFDSLTMTGI